MDTPLDDFAQRAVSYNRVGVLYRVEVLYTYKRISEVQYKKKIFCDRVSQFLPIFCMLHLYSSPLLFNMEQNSF